MAAGEQAPEMMRVAQCMTAVFISEVRFPMIMHRCSAESAEDSGCIHRFFPPFFMHIIIEEARRSRMQPIEFSFDTQSVFVRIQYFGMTEKLRRHLV